MILAPPEPRAEPEEKPKSSLCLIMQCAMHTYGESFAFCIVHCGWCEASASRSGYLTPRVTGTCWIGGWVGLRAGLCFVVRRLVLGLVTASEHNEPLAFKQRVGLKTGNSRGASVARCPP